MISPDFTRAMSMKTFMLDQPLALQLACVGSRSTINYGTKATVKDRSSCRHTETLQGNLRLSGAADDDSQRQGLMRMQLKL